MTSHHVRLKALMCIQPQTPSSIRIIDISQETIIIATLPAFNHNAINIRDSPSFITFPSVPGASVPGASVPGQTGDNTV